MFDKQREYNTLDHQRQTIAYTDGELISALYKTKYTAPISLVGIIDNDVTEISGIQKIGQKPIVRFIKSKNSPIISPSKNINSVIRWIFKMDRATVTVFKTGTVQIATSRPVNEILTIMERYLPGIKSSPVELVKTDGQFFINFVMNLDILGPLLSRYVTPIDQIENWRYNPELHAAAFLTWRNPKIVYLIYRKGLVIFQGAEPDILKKAPKIFTEIFEKYKIPLQIKNSSANSRLAIQPLTSPKREKVNKKQKGRERYNAAPSLSARKNGFYVRPDPAGNLRFYPIPANKAPIRTKVLRAYSNAGINIPEYVKNLFNLEGAQLKPKAEKKNVPTSFSAVKAGFYVKPGKGGLPQFYKMPKHVAPARKGVIEAYQRAGKNIPQTVKNQFGITATPSVMFIGGHRMNKIGGQNRINGVLASKYTMDQLLKIARNLGIAQASEKLKTRQVIELIKNKLGSSSPQFTIEGVPHLLLANGRVVRGDRTKQWALMTAAEKNAIGKKVMNKNFEEWKGFSNTDKYDLLLATLHSPPKGTPAKTPASSSSASSSVGSFAQNLEDELVYNKVIKNAFGEKYGRLVKNTNTTNLIKLIRQLPKGARGKPKQANVNKVTVKFLKNLKDKRHFEEIKKKFSNKIFISENLKKILKSDVGKYKNQLLNIAMTRNNKGLFPSQAEVAKKMGIWLRIHYPRRVKAAAPYEVENMTTGKVRMVYPSPPSPNRKTPNVPKLSVKKISPLKVKKRSPAYKRPRKPKPVVAGTGAEQ